MNYKIVIPARYQSSRLPGKPLRDIAGKTMLERTYQNAQRSQAEQVIVATDNEEIAQCVEAFGGEYCITSIEHHSGSDRVFEVAQSKAWDEQTVIVNVQCDEPFIEPDAINQLAQTLDSTPAASIATMASEHPVNKAFYSPHHVKVVCNIHHFALYFSRSALPHNADRWLCHHGIYAYRCEYLKQFVALPQAHIEKYESLEQLRALNAGHAIYVQRISPPGCFGIDDEEGLAQAITFVTTQTSDNNE